VTTETRTPAEASGAYAAWLARQPLADNTRRAYRVRVAQYCVYLAITPVVGGDPLRDRPAAAYAARDYRTWLKTVRKAKPASVNLSLAALDHFYRFLGLDPPDVAREDLPQAAPRALEPSEQVAFLRAVERSRSARDRAIAHLLFYTGLRLGECAALDVDDVALSARKGLVVVRRGKGDAYREVPLNAAVRATLDTYTKERAARADAAGEPALFLNPQERRGPLMHADG